MHAIPMQVALRLGVSVFPIANAPRVRFPLTHAILFRFRCRINISAIEAEEHSAFSTIAFSSFYILFSLRFREPFRVDINIYIPIILLLCSS